MLSGSESVSTGSSKSGPMNSPGVLLPSAAPAIERNDLVAADASFANWTHLSIRSRLQPLQAGEKSA